MELSSLVTGIQHIGVPAKDIAASAAFYESLGFRPELDTINETNGARVIFLRLHTLVIETYESGDAVGKPGAVDHIALDAVDVDAAFAQAKAQGLNVLDEEVHFLPFWEKGVRFFTVLGPNGEKVEYCQRL